MLSENAEAGVRMTFGFSLYAAPLQVTLIVYFGGVLRGLERQGHQNQKIVRCVVANTRR